MSLEIPIIYEDDVVVVINKPVGLVVHSDGKTEEVSVSDWVLEKYPEMREVGEPMMIDGKEILRPGIVHRLDRDTSGVLIIAKNQETFLSLKNQFKEGEIKKEYRAFVYGNIKEDSGVIDMPIGRSSKNFKQWTSLRDIRGTQREAITEFKVLGRGGEVVYLALFPKTGRTHQIRVHMKALGHPVVCDNLYASKRPCLLGFERQALHAFSAEFKTSTGLIRTEAPLPNDFEKACGILRF